MKRDNNFNKSKLTSIATNKSVVNVYVDSFSIEKVLFRFTEFENPSNTINVYLDFPRAISLAKDISSGALLRELAANRGSQKTIKFGGRKTESGVEANSVTLSMISNKRGEDVIYLNASIGPGKETSTGAFMMTSTTNKISVGMSIDSFKDLFNYVEAAVQAYLPFLMKDLLKAAEESRKNATANR